jgi:excisionase family DNA binding protein
MRSACRASMGKPMRVSLDRIELTDREANLCRVASRLMGQVLNRPHAGRIALVEESDGADISRLKVPPETLRLLSQVLALMASRQAFALYSVSSVLTTRQAAEVLGVSRPYLVQILEGGGIPYCKLGRHPRVLMKDVLAYKETMLVSRKKALDEALAAGEDLDGCDL